MMTLKYGINIVISIIIGFTIGFIYFSNKEERISELHSLAIEENSRSADRFSTIRADVESTIVVFRQAQRDINFIINTFDNPDTQLKMRAELAKVKYRIEEQSKTLVQDAQ